MPKPIKYLQTVASNLDIIRFQELETSILENLNFNFTLNCPQEVYQVIAQTGYVSPWDIEDLRLDAAQASLFIDKMDQMCMFMLELTTRLYAFNQFAPTVIVASCIQLVREDAGMTPFTAELERLTNVSVESTERCKSELVKILKIYRKQFKRRLPIILTQWMSPNLIVEAHKDHLLSFLSTFLSLDDCSTSKSFQKNKKIRKLSSKSDKQVLTSAAETCMNKIKTRISITGLWDSLGRLVREAV